nr:unnamed protein product [Callosobruchus analis]
MVKKGVEGRFHLEKREATIRKREFAFAAIVVSPIGGEEKLLKIAATKIVEIDDLSLVDFKEASKKKCQVYRTKERCIHLERITYKAVVGIRVGQR